MKLRVAPARLGCRVAEFTTPLTLGKCGCLRAASIALAPFAPPRAHPSDLLHVGVRGREVRTVNSPRLPASRATRAGGSRAGRGGEAGASAGVRRAPPGGPRAGQETRGRRGPSAGNRRPRQTGHGPGQVHPAGGGTRRRRQRVSQERSEEPRLCPMGHDAMKGGRDTPMQSSTHCHCSRAPKCPPPRVRQRLPEGTGQGCPDTPRPTAKSAAGAPTPSRNQVTVLRHTELDAPPR